MKNTSMQIFWLQTTLMEECSVCGTKGSTLTSMNDLDATQQAWFEEQHPQVAPRSLLCSLCVRYLQLAPFFTKKTPNSSVRWINASNVTNPVKKIKSKEPTEPGVTKHVAKTVTVDQHVYKYGKYGLFNNNGCRFATVVGRRWIINQKTASGGRNQ